MQYIRNVFLKEFILGVDIILEIIAESELDKFIDLLIIKL